MSSYNWAQGPMQENKDTNELTVTTYFPQWVRDSFICHQQIPLEMLGHFLPGKKVLTSLLEPTEWQFKGQSWTTTAQHCQTRPLGSYHFFLGPSRDARKCDLAQWCWVDWWSHQSCDSSHVCLSAPKDCGPCCSNTGSKWIQGGKLPSYLQATEAD